MPLSVSNTMFFLGGLCQEGSFLYGENPSTVNERAVRILLECFLVLLMSSLKTFSAHGNSDLIFQFTFQIEDSWELYEKKCDENKCYVPCNASSRHKFFRQRTVIGYV